MKKNSIIAGVAILALAGAVQMAKASIPIYPDKGTQNSTPYSFIAASSGNVTAYYAGGDASDIDLVGMMVNGAAVSGYGLPNNYSSDYGSASTIGQQFNLGYANAGDTLVFVLWNTTTKQYFYSDPTMNVNENGANHVYSTSYGGDSTLPSGVYVGFEDLLANDSNQDWDYNDTSFVFQNIERTPNTSSVPEPTTVVAGALLLLPFGVSTLRILRNRKLVSR
jgi:hypothetical protein